MATTSNAALRPSDVEQMGKLFRARSLPHPLVSAASHSATMFAAPRQDSCKRFFHSGSIHGKFHFYLLIIAKIIGNKELTAALLLQIMHGRSFKKVDL